MPSHAAFTTWAKECASGRNSITESVGSISADGRDRLAS